jgi:non-ribosomal peptide synthetase component F
MPSASFYFCREQIEIDVDLFRKVKTFANTGVYTPFMIMVAALSVVIHCQTKNRQIRIGTLVANRGKRETGVLIGYLMNTIILRIDVSPDMTLDELLTSARRVTLNAFAHEELPFEYLAQTMEKEQNSQRALLFETLLIYQRSSQRTDETFGLKLAPLEVNDERVEPEVLMSNVPLILRLRETSTTLTGTVNYKVNNFSSTDVVRMRKRIDATLRNIVAESIRSVPVGSLIALF